MIRLFVGLAIPQDVKTRLSLMQGGVPGARWVDEDNLHLTLRFIGEVTENIANDIDDALAVLHAPAFDLELAGTGEFGGRMPRALWAGIKPNEALLHLQKKVETALQRIGLEAELRKFSPHVTLARMRGAPPEKMMEFLSRHALFASGPFRIEHFVLFSSLQGSGGSVYRAERIYPLSA